MKIVCVDLYFLCVRKPVRSSAFGPTSKDYEGNEEKNNNG